MYAQVDKRPPRRGETMPHARLVRRLIAEHATRMIFASEPDPELAQLRPRIVDAARVKQEAEQLRQWHKEQTAAELELHGTKP